MDTFAIKVSATGKQPMQVTAGFLRYERCTAGGAYPRIRIEAENLRLVLAPGQSSRFPARHGFTIYNHDALESIEGLLHVGAEEEWISLPREVIQADAALESTKQRRGWSVVTDVAGVAAKYTALQLANPHGNNLIVDRISVALSAAGLVYLHRFYDPDLFTHGTNNPVSSWFGRDSNVLSDARLMYENVSPGVITGGYVPAHLFACDAAYSMQRHEPKRPIYIEYGQGLMLISNDVNVRMIASIEWREENPES